MFRTKAKYLLLLLFVTLQTNLPVWGQITSFPIEEWVKKLNSKDDSQNSELRKISSSLFDTYDSATVASALRQLENTGESGAYFKARLSFLKSFDLANRKGDLNRLYQLCEQSLYYAYQTGDDHYIAFVSWISGLTMEGRSELYLSAFYYLKADEIFSKFKQLPPDVQSYRFVLGENLYRTNEFEKCIEYTKKGFEDFKDTSWNATYLRIRYLNTIGQAYKQLGKIDSALAWYDRSIQLAHQLEKPVWVMINAVFIGEAWLLKKDYRKAKSFIQYIYTIEYTTEPKVIAYGLQLLAKIDLINGDKDSAEEHIKQAISLLNITTDNLVQKMDYLQHVYSTAADVFRAVGNADSFYHYSQLYNALHDSLQRVVTLSSLKVTQLRIDSEKNFRNLQQLQQEKETAALTRNSIIAFIIMLSLIAILALNRQRQKAFYKERLALHQKEVAEAKLAVADTEKKAAAEQLEQFTQNLVEKTSLIEKLELQLTANKNNMAQQQLIEELARQTILTEDNWVKFKTIFEKTHPGFFDRLKMASGDITFAEQRMAALTSLQLTTKQMAAVLGISPNSVIKAKQRLRQRFNLETDLLVETFLAKL